MNLMPSTNSYKINVPLRIWILSFFVLFFFYDLNNYFDAMKFHET